jgi:hypothetical protein
MMRLARLLAVCCTATALFATAALAESRTVTLSVSGMT